MTKAQRFIIWGENEQGEVFRLKQYNGAAIDGIKEVSLEVAAGDYGRAGVVIDIWAVPKSR